MTYVIASIVGLLVIAADQLTKYLVITNFKLGESQTVIKGVINFTYINNGGAAFGILQNKTWILLAITFFMLIICVGMLIKKTYRTPLMYWAVVLILAGGIGNMIDRLFRKGQVVDFIEAAFVDFPVFNVADISVCVGAGLVFLYFITDLVRDTKRKPQSIDADDILNNKKSK